jgi:5'(3')-deoxyribonucleotidase
MKFDEFINEKKNHKDLQFWIDMDGVLADFDRRIREDSKFVEAIEELASYMIDKYDIKVEILDDVREFAKTSKDKKFKKLHNKAKDVLYSIASKPGFFMELHEMPDVIQLFHTAKEISGKLPHILTAPINDKQYSKDDKLEWMNTHFEGLFDRFVADYEKFNYAKSKKDVLIDDRPKNVTLFRKAGGTAILHTSVEDTIQKMKNL